MSPSLIITIKAFAIGIAAACFGLFVYSILIGNCSGGDVIALGALCAGACTVSGIVVSG